MGVKWLAVLALALLLPPAAPAPDASVETRFTTTDSEAPAGGDEASDPPRTRADSRAPTASITVPIGADLGALYVEPTVSRAFVADRTNGRIIVVSVEGGNILSEIPVQAEPSSIAVTWDGRTMFVGHTGTQTILVVNLTTLQVERELPTQFFIRSLASPSPAYLIVTVHDPQGPGDYPWVLRTSDGTVVQRLDQGPGLSGFDYRDAVVTVGNGAGHLFLMSTGTGDIAVQSYRVADYSAGTWSYVATSPPGALGADGRDISAFSGSAPVYIARGSGPLLEINPTTLEPVRAFGTSPSSTSVTVSVWGDRLATSIGDGLIQVFTTGGTFAGTLSASAPVEILRTPWIPNRYVAVVGAGSTQDLEIGPTTQAIPVSPFGYVGNALPLVAVDVVYLSQEAEGVVAATIDGNPVQPESCTEANWCARPTVSLGDGVHTVRVRVILPMVDEVRWEFVVDTTAPMIQIPNAPFTSAVAELTLSGTVNDSTPVTLTVWGRDIPVAGGAFTATVILEPGENLVEFVARDAVGNENRFFLTTIYTALGDWFVHPATRFRIRPPFGWPFHGDVSRDGVVADLLAAHPKTGANLIVVSERRRLAGTQAEARAILQEALDELAQSPGFLIQVPVSDLVIDGLPAARVVFWSEGGGSRFQQILVVVVGANERRFWALLGTMFDGQLHTMGVWLDASIRSFESLGPGPLGPLGDLSVEEVGLLVGIVGAAVVGSVLVVLLVRRRRRRRQPPAPPG